MSVINTKTKLTVADKKKIRKLRRKVLIWGRHRQRVFLWRKQPTPCSILIAEFFLQRTKALQAERQFKIFMHRYPNFHKLETARTKELGKILLPLGLKKKTSMLKRLIKEISKKHNGKIPTEYKDLKKLHGVGDYTANAIVIFALNKPAGLVDANTIKVFSDVFNLRMTREQGKNSKFIKQCAEYYSSLGNPRLSNWLLLDYVSAIGRS